MEIMRSVKNQSSKVFSRCVVAGLGVGLSLFSACGPTIKDSTKADLKRPVNCATAKTDVQTLEGARASTQDQLVAGARFILPAAAVVGILRGDYDNRVRVAVGQYNDDIDKKIASIKSTCFR